MLLIVPIKLKSGISYNLLKNKGRVEFDFYKLKLLSYKLKIKTRYIMLTDKNDKNILLPIEFGESSNIEYYDLSVILVNKTTINSVKINVNLGFENNPFLTAIIYGLTQTISSSVLSVLKAKKLSVEIVNNIKHEYYKDSGTIYIKLGITISLFDLMWGFILYKLNLKKVGKNYERMWKKSNWSNYGRSNE